MAEVHEREGGISAWSNQKYHNTQGAKIEIVKRVNVEMKWKFQGKFVHMRSHSKEFILPLALTETSKGYCQMQEHL